MCSPQLFGGLLLAGNAKPPRISRNYSKAVHWVWASDRYLAHFSNQLNGKDSGMDEAGNDLDFLLVIRSGLGTGRGGVVFVSDRNSKWA